MPNSSGVEFSEAYRYEVGVGLALGSLALLWRDNPFFVYPHILYLILLMLAANLASGLAMRRFDSSWLFGVSTTLNLGLISAILGYSGGHESNLWPLYLLPIYTACLILSGREVLWVTAGTVSFCLAFHILSVAHAGRDVFFSVIVKCSVLTFAAGAVWRVVKEHRSTALRLSARREEMQRVERRFDETRRDLDHALKGSDIGLLSGSIFHDMGAPISVILGSVEILESAEASAAGDLREDVGRIRRSAMKCRELIERFRAFTQSESGAYETVELGGLVAGAMKGVETAGARRGLAARFERTEEDAPVRCLRAQVERAFARALEELAAELAEGGSLTARVSGPDSGGDGWSKAELKCRLPAAKAGRYGSGAPLDPVARPGMYLLEKVLVKHGGVLDLSCEPDGAFRLEARFPAYKEDGLRI